MLNLEGHLNCCIALQVTVTLLNGWILPNGGVASGRVFPAACAAGLFFKIVDSLNVNKFYPHVVTKGIIKSYKCIDRPPRPPKKTFHSLQCTNLSEG